MLEKRGDFLKCSAPLLLILVFFTNGSATNVETSEINLNFFDFDGIKNDFFLQSDFNVSNTDRTIDLDNVRRNLKCLKQLAEVQRGLRQFEIWSMKSKFLSVLEKGQFCFIFYDIWLIFLYSRELMLRHSRLMLCIKLDLSQN